MWHWRSKYSLGVNDIWATAWPPKIDSEPYRLYFMRWWKLSSFTSVSGTQAVPVSVMT